MHSFTHKKMLTPTQNWTMWLELEAVATPCECGETKTRKESISHGKVPINIVYCVGCNKVRKV